MVVRRGQVMGKRSASVGAALLSLAVLCAPHGALAQTTRGATPRPPSVDVAPDVVITASTSNFPTDKADVIAARMPRVARCLSADQFSPDPTKKFNQAYYEELTGQADYYEQIRGAPPKMIPVIPFGGGGGGGFGGGGFGGGGGGARMTRFGENFIPGQASILASPMNASSNRKIDTSCEDRGRMENSVTFARALAMIDKGDYAGGLNGLIQAHGELRRSPLGGEAALMIAGIYLTGRGDVPRDMKQALVWLEKAADTPTSWSAAARYDPKNPDRYYSVAAEAASALGRIYLTGAGGVPQDPRRVSHWVEVARNAHHAPAIKVMGDMFYVGYGNLKKNLRTARMSYDNAGRVGHQGAQFLAAEMYRTGEAGLRDMPLAMDLYTRSAAGGEVRAMYALAIAYDTGEGVRADPVKAIGFYKDAALMGSPEAQTALGTYFYKGEQVTKDLPTARAWFGEAAIRGDPDAMVNLAAMMSAGEGGEVDRTRAWAWLTLAKNGGRDDMGPGLAALEVRMSAAELAQAKALVAPGPPPTATP